MVNFRKLLDQTPEEREAARKEAEQAYLERLAKKQAIIDSALDIDDGITPWEEKFIRSVAKQFKEEEYLSDKQWETLKEVVAKWTKS